MLAETKCTRCKKEHEEDNSYCLDCKSYMRMANKRRNSNYYASYSVPNNSVYAFINKDNEYVYIGSSSEPAKRIHEHYNDNHKTFNPRINGLLRQLKYRYRILYTGDDYSHHEKVLINKHNPQFNTIKYVKYNEEIRKSSRNWRSTLSFRLRQIFRFLFKA